MFNLFKKKKDTNFHISCFQTDQSELAYCKVGDSVNLWYPKDENSVRLYRPGTFSGEGLIGVIKGAKSRKIIYHLKIGNQIETQIEQIKKGAVLINCRVISAQELKEQKNKKIDEIINEINKPYNPKNTTYTLYTKSKTELKVNDSLGYEINDLRFDIIEKEKLDYLRIRLFKSDHYIGDISAQNIVRKLMRAYNSNLLPSIKITEIEISEETKKIKLKIGFEIKPAPDKGE